MMTRRSYQVRGMDCAEEIEALKGTVGKLPGVADLGFNLLNGSMTLSLPDGVADGAVLEAVRRAGLQASPIRPGIATGGGPGSFWERRGRLLACAGSGLALAAGLALCGWRCLLPGAGDAPLSIPAMACLLAAAALGLWHILPRAAASASSLRPDMNLLMTIAILGALALGDWTEAASASFLFALALWLESWSVARSRHAIQSMTRLSPATARQVRPDGSSAIVAANAIHVDDIILVGPGERIPLDATVTGGSGSVNESPLTGESTPIHKIPGSEVFAGTINNESPLTLRVAKPASDTMLARIIRMVEEAENRRAPAEQWVDRFARRYTPVMIVLAMAIAILPPLALHAPWTVWFNRALIVLVIACPCALVISTPVGIIAGLTAAARHGVLIKGGVHLETASRLAALAIDKTGTLTLGVPSVQQVVALHPCTADEVLALAAALESMNRHPLAMAICREAAARRLTPPPVDASRILPGKGVTGMVNGRPMWIGGQRLMEDMQAGPDSVNRLVRTLEDAGHSVVLLGAGHETLGVLSITDAVRPGAAAMVSALHDAGIRHVIMLTGDNQGTAAAIARQTGMERYEAGLLPDDKMRHVHRLAADHGWVGMLGDGVNDAPAMAASSLGIAMAAAGSDTAIESADVALMTDDLMRVPWLIRHARRVMATIRANACFAIGIKALILLLSLGGMANLWMAIAADTGATLVVVLWSLRLLKS